jgi:hypothetical protein
MNYDTYQGYRILREIWGWDIYAPDGTAFQETHLTKELAKQFINKHRKTKARNSMKLTLVLIEKTTPLSEVLKNLSESPSLEKKFNGELFNNQGQQIGHWTVDDDETEQQSLTSMIKNDQLINDAWTLLGSGYVSDTALFRQLLAQVEDNQPADTCQSLIEKAREAITDGYRTDAERRGLQALIKRIKATNA